VTIENQTPGYLGSGGFAFEVETGWGTLPDGWTYGEVVGVAVDSQDLIYAYTRGSHPVIVFDADGEFVRSWGYGAFPGRPHAITIDAQDRVFCVDDRAHTIFQFNTEGELQGTIGSSGVAGRKWSGDPLNLPTDMAVSPVSGEIFVTDGYGNARVHRFSAEGEHIQSWGESGIAPGEFAWPHNVEISPSGTLYVCDRENHRMQVFDEQGTLLDVWYDVYRPNALTLDAQSNVVVGELCTELFLADAPNLGHRLSIFDKSGKLQTRLGDPFEGEAPGQFIAPHSLATDSQGSIYVGEVSWSMRGRFLHPPREMRSLQKLRRAETSVGSA
jgi:DNA-binding beta-propeller fold protein YncE